MTPRSSADKALAGRMAEAGSRLARAGTILSGEGNLSVRVDDASFLITASGCDKGRLGDGDVVVVDVDDDDIPPRASCETRLHRGVYRRRPDVNAVVHAHPRRVLVLAAEGRVALQGALVRHGEPGLRLVWIPRLEPGSMALAAAAAEALARADCCVLEGHGAVAVADSLETAVDRMLTVERLAETVGG